MIAPSGALAVLLAAFRIVGAGHSIPVAQIDSGPCPQGQWSQALYAATSPRRIGTLYGCGLRISKGTAAGLDPAWIRQTAREHFVLPGGSLTATCNELFRFSRDQQHSRATFSCRIAGGGSITGGGGATDGRANYTLAIKR